jgi:hypothetical protein
MRMIRNQGAKLKGVEVKGSGNGYGKAWPWSTQEVNSWLSKRKYAKAYLAFEPKHFYPEASELNGLYSLSLVASTRIPTRAIHDY